MPDDGRSSFASDSSQDVLRSLNELETTVEGLSRSTDQLDGKIADFAHQMDFATVHVPRIRGGNGLTSEEAFAEHRERIQTQSRQARELKGFSAAALTEIRNLKEDLPRLSPEERRLALEQVQKRADTLRNELQDAGRFGEEHAEIERLAKRLSSGMAGMDDEGAEVLGRLARSASDMADNVGRISRERAALEERQSAFKKIADAASTNRERNSPAIAQARQDIAEVQEGLADELTKLKRAQREHEDSAGPDVNDDPELARAYRDQEEELAGHIESVQGLQREAEARLGDLDDLERREDLNEGAVASASREISDRANAIADRFVVDVNPDVQNTRAKGEAFAKALAKKKGGQSPVETLTSAEPAPEPVAIPEPARDPNAREEVRQAWIREQRAADTARREERGQALRAAQAEIDEQEERALAQTGLSDDQRQAITDHFAARRVLANQQYARDVKYYDRITASIVDEANHADRVAHTPVSADRPDWTAEESREIFRETAAQEEARIREALEYQRQKNAREEQELASSFVMPVPDPAAPAAAGTGAAAVVAGLGAPLATSVQGALAQRQETPPAPEPAAEPTSDALDRKLDAAIDAASDTPPTTEPTLRVAPADEPAAPAAPVSGTPATALGAPLAASVLGASAEARNRAPTDAGNDDDEADPDKRAARLEHILRQLDAEEGALNARFDALEANRKRLSKKQHREEAANILEAHAAIQQQRLDLLQKYGELPERNGVVYDQASLQASIAHALEQVQNVRPLRQATVAPAVVQPAPAAPAAPTADLAQVGLAVAQAFAAPAAPAPAADAASRVPTVKELRAELREERKLRAYSEQVLTTYKEYLHAHSVEWLRKHDPARHLQWSGLQSRTSVTVDASAFLNATELQEVQAQALIDLRIYHPEVDEHALSQMLIAKAAATLAVADVLDKEATLAGATALLAQAQKATASTTVAALAPMAMGLLKEMNDTRVRLRDAEEAELVRSGQIKALATGAPLAVPLKPGETIETLRREQRDSPAKRRALQAALQGQLASLGMLRQLAQQALNNGQDAQAAQVGALVIELLERHGHHASASAPTASRVTASAQATNVGSGASRVAPPLVSTQTATNAPADPDDSAAHAANIVARLQAGKLRDQQLSRNGGSAAGSSAASGGGPAASAAPLLALPVAAATAQDRFAQAQNQMVSNIAQFTGDGATQGGYEATFGTDAIAPGDIPTQTATLDDGPEITEGEEELTEEELEAQRVAELLQDQQRAAQAQDQAGGGGQSGGLLDAANQLRNLPGGQQAVGTAAKAAVANPIGIVVLVFIAFFWLNARLFFPKEGSFFRKPMGTLGKVGTVAFDIAFVFILLIALIITIAMAVVPFLPFLLPLIGGFAILQAALHLFGN